MTALSVLLLGLSITAASCAGGAAAELDRNSALIGYREAECEDKDTLCVDWATAGECTKNPGYMHASCRLACSMCVPQSTGAAALSREALAASPQVAIQTTLGAIRIILYHKMAPRTCALVLEAAGAPQKRTGRFYRAEVQPPPGSLGPPYGLLQGSMPGLGDAPPKEGNVPTQQRHAVFIPGTREFFLAVAGHAEWATAHSVWGEVLLEDWTVVEAIVGSDFHDFKHPDFGTVMRMMNREMPFTLELPDV